MYAQDPVDDDYVTPTSNEYTSFTKNPPANSYAGKEISLIEIVGLTWGI